MRLIVDADVAIAAGGRASATSHEFSDADVAFRLIEGTAHVVGRHLLDEEDHHSTETKE